MHRYHFICDCDDSAFQEINVMKGKLLMPEKRDTLVRNLTPEDAGDLLVHAHWITPERRKALLFWKGPASAYFNAEECAQIREWIAKEDYLPADESPDHHPRRPQPLIVVEEEEVETPPKRKALKKSKILMVVRLREDQVDQLKKLAAKSSYLDQSKLVRIAVDWMLQNDLDHVLSQLNWTKSEISRVSKPR